MATTHGGLADTSGTTSRTRTGAQWLALGVGALFLLAGIAGFFITGLDGFAAHNPDQTLLGLAVNPLHNIVHLLAGVAGLLLATSHRGAKTYGWILVVGYGATLLYGLIVAGGAEGNFLNINTPDNVFHGAVVLLGLVMALWPSDRHRVR